MRSRRVVLRGAVGSRLHGLVFAAAALLLLARLGATDLWAPDEPRYAQVAAELFSMRHGPEGLVLLHLNGEPYTQKPPLYYWLAALCGIPAGAVTEVAARLPSALSGIALVALTLRFGSRLLGGTSGVLGAVLLLTTFAFAHLARRVQLDVLLALWETLALVAFWRLDRGLGRPRLQVVGLHAALGMAVLTKGPVGVLVPAVVMAAYLAWEGRARQLLRAFPPWAFALSLGPALAWLGLAVWLAPPGFFGEAVGENVFGRFFAGTSHARPVHYYLYQLPVELLPWTLLVPLVVWAAWRRVFVPERDAERTRAWRFLLAWVGASLVFFSLSTGKRGLYLVPTFPACALLFADALVVALAGRVRAPRWMTWGLAGLAVAFVVAGVGLGVADPLAAPRTSWMLGGAVVAIALAACAGWRLLGRIDPRPLPRLAIPLAAALAIEALAFTVAWPALDPEKSPRPIAEAAASVAGPGEAVGLVRDRALAGGLVYYGVGRVVELDDAASIAAFLDRGGRVLVVSERKLTRVQRVTPVEVRFRARSGRRAMLVVTPARDGAS